MKRIFLFLVVVLIPVYFFTLSGCESTTSSPDGSGVIRGTIKDSTNNTTLLAGVTVTTVPATSTVVTDNAGNYIISGVSDDTYIVTAKKPFYFTKTASVTVNRRYSCI